MAVVSSPVASIDSSIFALSRSWQARWLRSQPHRFKLCLGRTDVALTIRPSDRNPDTHFICQSGPTIRLIFNLRCRLRRWKPRRDTRPPDTREHLRHDDDRCGLTTR